MQYYTIDDLRRSPDQSGRSGWSMERFSTLEEALARYRTLPASGARSVGLTDGLHVLELARRAVLFPAESPCEDVQAASPEALPLWANRPEAIAAARAAVSALHLRYRISGRMAVPVPPAGKPRWELRDKYLWLSGESGQETALRWAYLAGAGWKQPAFLRRWNQAALPLVLRFRADGITEQGAYLPLEITPWEYEYLMRRTLERREKER